MKKYLKYIIIAVVIIAAIVIFTQVKKHKSKPEWRTDKPSTGTIREVVTATGALNPYVLVEVGTEVSGKIVTLYKDFNDTVKKGDVLAKLDTDILATSLQSTSLEVSKADLTLKKAREELAKNKKLLDQDMISQESYDLVKYDYEQADQNLKSAQLREKSARKNLNNATITSPINGVIISRAVSEGQTVAASMSSPTLFTIANNLDQMQITANVDEADIGKIKKDMPVEFTVDAYAGEQFTGSVDQIRLNSTTEQNVVSYSVIIAAANPDHKLLPGMTTNVTIVIQAKENALRIPETATRFAPSKEVWELFGMKWQDNLISDARKKAVETAMANQKPPADKAVQPPDPKSNTGKPTAAIDSAKTPNVARRSPGRRGGMPGPMGGGRSGSAMIWVLRDKTPELIMVRTGVSDGAFVEVIGELDPNTVIITGVNYKDPSKAPGASAIQSGPGMGPRF